MFKLGLAGIRLSAITFMLLVACPLTNFDGGGGGGGMAILSAGGLEYVFPRGLDACNGAIC